MPRPARKMSGSRSPVKALRNVAFAFLPEWLVDKAFDAAKGNIRADIEKAVTTHGMEKVVARAIERRHRLDAARRGCSP